MHTELSGFGDEAYLWADRGTGEKPNTPIHLRKANVHVIVNAPSERLAKRFARHIVSEIVVELLNQ